MLLAPSPDSKWKYTNCALPHHYQLCKTCWTEHLTLQMLPISLKSLTSHGMMSFRILGVTKTCQELFHVSPRECIASISSSRTSPAGSKMPTYFIWRPRPSILYTTIGGNMKSILIYQIYQWFSWHPVTQLYFLFVLRFVEAKILNISCFAYTSIIAYIYARVLNKNLGPLSAGFIFYL